MFGVRTTEKGFGIAIEKTRRIDGKVIEAGKLGIQRGLYAAQGLAQREYLRGPRPTRLDVKTGRLRNSLWVKIGESATTAQGILGSNVKYAAFHEFGFTGTVNVKAHKRAVKAMKDGKRIEPRKAIMKDGKRIGWKMGLAPAAADAGAVVTYAEVRAHSRRVDYAGKPYARPAVTRSLPMMIAEMKREMEKG